MCEKFNNGNGGYICDTCRVLLWAGRDGSIDKSNRRYWYKINEEDVVEKYGKFFCSQECAAKYIEEDNESDS